MSDEEFLSAFEQCTLPKGQWTHTAHVRMAWLYLTRLPFTDALVRVREGIRRYNASVGSDGYHETITVAFTLLIRSRLSAPQTEDFLAFRAGNPDLFEKRAGLLERHYNPATLTSAAAKRQFVDPDREPLPWPGREPVTNHREGHRMSSRRLIDVSHVVEDGMVTYKGLPAPLVCDYLSREASRQIYAAGVEFQIGKIEMVANTGTYLDSPFHRYADGTDLAGLALEKLAALDALVVRWSRPAADGRGISAETFGGLDVRGMAVLVHTGWDAHWRTDQYFEGHPYLTADAALWLRDHGAALVGIDSLNIDDTADPHRPVHSTLLRAEVPIVEHLRGLGQLPEAGFRFFAVPVKVKGMGTFPVRAFGLVGG
jgi:kynurenine formamidase